MIAANASKRVDILVVEDNPGDVRLITEALKKSNLSATLHVVSDGEQALQFLERSEPYENAPLPDLMLLDLNLPRLSGEEVLAELKTHPTNRRIPVIVLTSSQAQEDILKAYDRHANCYIVKPTNLKDFFYVINDLETFWLTRVKLPTFNAYDN